MKEFCMFSLVSMSMVLVAQEADTEAKGAAQNARNPLAFVTKLQIQSNYTFKDNSGDQLILISRIMQPS